MFTLKASLFILKDYPLELFTWGSNTNFALGHRDESTRYAPEIVECGEGDAKLFIKEVSYHWYLYLWITVFITNMYMYKYYTCTLNS